MNPVTIIDKYYESYPIAREILINHSIAVSQMALDIAQGVSHMNPDMQFVKEAAILHDIGMFLTNMPKLDCHGKEPYIAHGVLGRNLLEQEGLSRHALVCERHVGIGLTAADIKANGFPIPPRDMIPLSIEEQIICFADKFYSKVPGNGRKSLNEVRLQIKCYGIEKLRIFDRWTEIFNINDKGFS